jgi:toxin ParE1/3/4
VSRRRRRYRVTDQAKTDLLDIARYMSQNRAGASIRVLEAIKAAFRALSESPGMGTACEFLSAGLRRFSPRRPAHNYVIFFRDNEADAVIEIVAVIHGARDAQSALVNR